MRLSSQPPPSPVVSSQNLGKMDHRANSCLTKGQGGRQASLAAGARSAGAAKHRAVRETGTEAGVAVVSWDAAFLCCAAGSGSGS